MHELSIAIALVDQVSAVVAAERAARAGVVGVRIGTLSGVDSEALRLAFPVAAEGSVCAEAALEIEVVAARVLCHACGAESRPETFFAVCEQCGSTDVDIPDGRDLLLTRVEVESE